MRFVAGRGTVAESHREAFAGRGAVAERLQRGGAMAEHLLARGTVAENHREAFAGQGCCSGAPSGSSHCRKGKKSHCRKGRKSHCWKGEILLERRATARKVRKGVTLPARRDCSGATGWSLFLMRPLCKLFLYL